MKALITGVTSQDASYLAELLLAKGYEVHGTLRWCSTFGHTARIDHLRKDITTHYCDMTDGPRLEQLIREIAPDELYNLAAQSHVGVSFLQRAHTWDVNKYAVEHILAACQTLKIRPRLYQASTSEMFGNAPAPQHEGSPMKPVSPYAQAKYSAHKAVLAAQTHMFAVGGILFNHESPRRGKMFVTRKITDYVARLALGLTTEKLHLGNIAAVRDWGYAPEYVEAMWLMLQQEMPVNYVIATGESHTVAEFLEAAFSRVGLLWPEWVEHDPVYERPKELHELRGNPSRAKERLGWEPTVRFKELVRIMVDADLDSLRNRAGG